MPTFYKIDKERKLVMTTYSGVLTIAEALGHQEKLSLTARRKKAG